MNVCHRCGNWRPEGHTKCGRCKDTAFNPFCPSPEAIAQAAAAIQRRVQREMAEHYIGREGPGIRECETDIRLRFEVYTYEVRR